MKKIPWIYISLIAAIISFIVLWLLIGSWKASLLLGILSGIITFLYNPVRRYMKAFWSVISILITTNTFSLKFVLNFFRSESFGNIESQIGESSIVYSIALVLLCALLLVLDYFERSETPILNWCRFLFILTTCSVMLPTLFRRS